jgi:hypothetical protein
VVGKGSAPAFPEPSLKKILALPVLVALLLSGCTPDDAESLVKQTVAVMDETAQAMATIQDEPSAKAAVPRLQALARRRKLIEEKITTVKTPSQADQVELQKKYAARLSEVTVKLMQESVRVSAVPGGTDALDAMDPK